MNSETPFVADSDPEFLKLREGLREEIRKTEAQFRKDMSEMLANLPPDFRTHFEPLASELPARFLRGLLPFFAGLSEMMEAALELRDRLAVEALREHGLRTRRFMN